MKVLFIGEGRHDIGDTSPNPYHPRPAHGTIPTLARRVCTGIAPESVALAWTEVRRFNPSAQKGGYPAKVAAAALVAVRKFSCAATVVVADRDGRSDRQAELEEGAARACRLFPQHRTAWGLAIESVEAWTLGVPDKIAEELGIEAEAVRRLYPPGVSIEQLSERSGKEGHRPKRLLERIANLTHRSDSTEFRQAIAEKTDPTVLEKECRQGFAPFAEQLRSLIGT